MKVSEYLEKIQFKDFLLSKPEQIEEAKKIKVESYLTDEVLKAASSVNVRFETVFYEFKSLNPNYSDLREFLIEIYGKRSSDRIDLAIARFARVEGREQIKELIGGITSYLGILLDNERRPKRYSYDLRPCVISAAKKGIFGLKPIPIIEAKEKGDRLYLRAIALIRSGIKKIVEIEVWPIIYSDRETADKIVAHYNRESPALAKYKAVTKLIELGEHCLCPDDKILKGVMELAIEDYGSHNQEKVESEIRKIGERLAIDGLGILEIQSPDRKFYYVPITITVEDLPLQKQ